MTRARVGLDVGGTAVKAGRIDAEGNTEAELSAPVPPRVDSDELLGILLSLARELDASGSIGIGVPGLLDRERGVVLQSPNLPGLDGLGLRDGLAAGLDLAPDRVHVENDANAAALGEQWLGAGRGDASLLLLTLGTGIGGGLLLDDELYVGCGMAGEIGHVTIRPDGPPCGCGSRGCLETYASATAARRRAVERNLPAGDPGNLERLAELAREREGPERGLYFEVGRDLGYGLGAAVCLLDLRCFVFSGGFSAAFDVLEPGIRQGLRESAYGDRVAGVRLARAALGSKAGWIGAARLALG